MHNNNLYSHYSIELRALSQGISHINVGAWRKGPVYAVSGQMGKEKIHFEAPPAERVEEEMQSFLQWVNEGHSIDLVLKAAVAHQPTETPTRKTSPEKKPSE